MYLLLLTGIYTVNYDGVYATLIKSYFKICVYLCSTTWHWSSAPIGKNSHDVNLESVSIGCECATDTSYEGSIRIDGGAPKRWQRISIKASWNPRTQTTYINHLFLHDTFRNSELLIGPLDQVILQSMLNSLFLALAVNLLALALPTLASSMHLTQQHNTTTTASAPKIRWKNCTEHIPEPLQGANLSTTLPESLHCGLTMPIDYFKQVSTSNNIII